MSFTDQKPFIVTPELSNRADNPKRLLDDGAWTPSIFMPRRASRITLEITEIRVERVQDISEMDAVAEGVIGAPELVQFLRGDTRARCLYAALWDSINGKKHPWASNPFCWVITFKLL